MIDKKDLKHGVYYQGHCRNAEIAIWNGTEGHFVHWRYKFGAKFLETICHPDDDQVYDVFEPFNVIEQVDLPEGYELIKLKVNTTGNTRGDVDYPVIGSYAPKGDFYA